MAHRMQLHGKCQILAFSLLCMIIILLNESSAMIQFTATRKQKANTEKLPNKI